MRKILMTAALLCLGASTGSCGGGGNAGGAIAPGQPLDIPFGNYQIIAYHANQFFTATQGESYVYAVDLQYQLSAGLPVFVLDVRPGDVFAADGHIPGAVNVPATSLFTEAGLATLPVDGTPIVVVAAEEHTAALVAGVLGTMSYPASTLRFGMAGWNARTRMVI
jgi:rhodanese-related sulfurtransferase